MSAEEKQHFIQVDKIDDEEGHLYKIQLLADHWINPVADQQSADVENSQSKKLEATCPELVITDTDEKPQLDEPAESIQPDQPDSLFPTEVDEIDITDAQDRISKLILENTRHFYLN